MRSANSQPNPLPSTRKKSSSVLVSPERLRLRIKAAAESMVRSGHPWVFAESVREQNREGRVGELAVIYDRNNKFLAVGLFDPTSPIRVRVLHAGKPAAINADFWRSRLDTAVRRRDGMFDERTTGYRLLNGESDGWPGLVLDRYDTTLVLKIYSAAWLSRMEEIAGLIRERLNPERIVLRMSRNIQNFVESHATPPHPIQRGKGESLSAEGEIGAIQFGPALSEPVVFAESGLRFEANVLRGQKTGFFLDQRENRRIVETLARERRVLNAFSFSGGFSIYSARGGARSVTDLDVSMHALTAAERNFILNRSEPAVARAVHESVRADAFEWLAGNQKQKFDLIVLDPPSLAKREAERAGAIRAYRTLVQSSLKHLQPEGILVACSCSAHVTAEEFFGAVRRSVAESGRRFVELRTTRHAPDHPVTFAEADYLKAIYLRLS